MIVVGLTGSIAMGKSTVASMFAQFGAPVFDADAAVRDFYRGEGANVIKDIFPGALVDGRVDRDRLSQLVLCDTGALKRLEGLVHPAVSKARHAFVDKAASAGRRFAVVDVPLLLETGSESDVDLIVVVSAPTRFQRERALARNGMTEEKFNSILAQQMSDLEKRRRSHFIIDTGGTHDRTRSQVGQLLRVSRGWRDAGIVMREIVLDTETTGLNPLDGHRVLEIGAVEIVHQVLTGRVFHQLINPERDIPDEAVAVHGHTANALKDKPVFAQVVEDFLSFVGEAPLVIHNAEFDVRFLNAELARLGRKTIELERVVDTLALARKKHPGLPNSLDALCDRYRIDRSRRVKHGALLDAKILVEVYCELTGGRQRSLLFSRPNESPPATIFAPLRQVGPDRTRPLLVEADEETAHAEHIRTLGEDAVWCRYVLPNT